MGSWGPENLSSDGALDVLHERSEALVKELVQLVESREAAEYDEYAHSLLFVLFETLFSLARHGLIGSVPEAGEAAIMKECYLERWDAYMQKAKQHWPERRAVIQRTFERFERLCRREELRSESAPVWVELVPQTIQEIAPALVFSPHLVFGAYHVSLPTTWSTSGGEYASALPAHTLASILARGHADSLRIGDEECEVGRIFFATGPSLAPERVDAQFQPYLLLLKIRSQSSKARANTHRLAAQSEEELAPFFTGDGEYVSGVVVPEIHESFDFDGVESFRHLDSASLIMRRDLYFHSLVGNELLLMEYGSVKNTLASDFPDWVLVEHLLNSLRPVSE